MHATSAVALAVVALNAASTLAIPTGPIGEGLEARSLYRRGPTATTPGNGTTVADSSTPGSQQKGSATTVTVTVTPRPTPCKAGETPVPKKSKKKGSSHKQHGAEGAEKNPNADKKASPAQPIVARSASVSATPTGKETPAAPGPTPAPENKDGQHHKAGAGAVFSSNTHVGKDHSTTVRHFVKATTTGCHAASETQRNKGSHKGDKASKPEPGSVDGAAGKQTPIKGKAGAKVARSLDAQTPTPTEGSKTNEKGHATTLTVTVTPRPTPCKAGETPSVQKKSKKKGSSHKQQGAEGADKQPNADKKASPAQPIAARSASASPTSSVKENPAAPAPTPAPEHKDGQHHKAGAGAVFSSNTHVGKDHSTTVRHFVKATTTGCHAAAETQRNKGSHKNTKGSKPEAGTTDGTASKQAPIQGKPKTSEKLVARAVDILERYFSELDELD